MALSQVGLLIQSCADGISRYVQLALNSGLHLALVGRLSVLLHGEVKIVWGPAMSLRCRRDAEKRNN